MDPVLEEGGDSWSVKEETSMAHDEAVVQSHSVPPVRTGSLGWPGLVHRNTIADEGYELSTLLTLRKKNGNPGGNQKRSRNPGQKQALLPPLNSVPRKVRREVSFASPLCSLI